MKTVDNIKLTKAEDIDPELLKICQSVDAKRAKTVIDHILQHGIITTEELSQIYGYDHPPRAIRDVRENGIPLITHRVMSKTTGRRIGAYTFDDLAKIKRGRIGGRKAFSKKFKEELIQKYGSKDAFTGTTLEARYLQIDHRIPYEISGNDASLDNLDEFMLIDASSQRAKSWSCEHCSNFLSSKVADICRSCFWAYPESYTHVALEEERRITIAWRAEETVDFDRLSFEASENKISVQELIKEKIKESNSSE